MSLSACHCSNSRGRLRASPQVLALLTVLATATTADAGIGSWGDDIAYVGDGGHAAWMIGQSQDVGYKYSHVAVLGLNLWAWDGTYCVYQRFEHKYVPITSAKAAEFLGKKEEDLQPPFEYRYPPGLLVFGPILALAFLLRTIRVSRARQMPVESTTGPSEGEKGTVDQEKGQDEHPS